MNSKLVIAFGSGGTKGLASLGVMSVFHENGIRPSAVAGSSVGAFIAAYYGVHGETDTLREWYEKQKTGVFYSLVSRGPLRKGLMVPTKLRTLVGDFLEQKRFRHTMVPVTIVAADLYAGKTKFFRHGDLAVCVIASGSIPGLMPPVKIGRRYYVDGGVTDPTPIDAFKRKDGQHILGIDYSTIRSVCVREPTATEAIKLSYDASRRVLVDHQREHHHPDCTIIQPAKRSKDLFSLANLQKNLKNGEKQARRLIRKWDRQGL